jgi:hypothetical protein
MNEREAAFDSPFITPPWFYPVYPVHPVNFSLIAAGKL